MRGSTVVNRRSSRFTFRLSGEGGPIAIVVTLAMVATLVFVLASSSLPSARANGDDDDVDAEQVTVRKVIVPADDLGRFDLFVNGQPIFESAADGNSGTVNGLDFDEKVTVRESLGNESPAGLTLGDYESSILCTQGSTTLFDGPGTSATFGVSDEKPIAPVDCTITNTRIVEPEELEEPLPADKDGDGLSDALEARLGTDPCNPDTDGDGRSDSDELFIDQTNPRDPLNLEPPVAPGCPAPGQFAPMPTQDRQLALFGGGPIRQFQGLLDDLGYESASFSLQNGVFVTLPADPTSPGMFTFFTAFDDFDGTGLGRDSDFDPFLDREVPCTPTLLDTALIFTDGFESGNTSAWSSLGP